MFCVFVGDVVGEFGCPCVSDHAEEAEYVLFGDGAVAYGEALVEEAEGVAHAAFCCGGDESEGVAVYGELHLLGDVGESCFDVCDGYSAEVVSLTA